MDFGLGTRGGFVLVVLGGIVIPGLSNHALSSVGYDTLGSVLWALGYGSMALVLWYGWVRPIDFSGSAEEGKDADSTGGDPPGEEPAPEAN